MNSLSGSQGFYSIHWKLEDQLIIFLSVLHPEKCEKYTQDSNKGSEVQSYCCCSWIKNNIWTYFKKKKSRACNAVTFAKPYQDFTA